MERLAEVDGLIAAATDHSGTFLRVALRDELALEGTKAVLSALGSEAALLPRDEGARVLAEVTRWYGPDAVSELSREEARVLGGEIAAGSEAEEQLGPESRERLRASAEARLFESFTEHGRGPSRLIDRAIAGIVTDAAEYVEPDRAKRLALFLERWTAKRAEAGAPRPSAGSDAVR